MILLVSRDRDYLYLLDTTEYIPPEGGDRIQSTKHCVWNKIDNIHICDIYVDIRRFHLGGLYGTNKNDLHMRPE
jgi:hypothetical protein